MSSPREKQAPPASAATSGCSGNPGPNLARQYAESKWSCPDGLDHPRLVDAHEYLQDPFNLKCIDIIDEAFAVASTAAELSDARSSAEIALRLKGLARSLKRSCNRLVYKLEKTAKHRETEREH